MWIRPLAQCPASSSNVDAAKVTRLMEAVGEPDARALPRAIVDFLGAALPARHCAVFVFSEQGRPRLCFEAGVGSAQPIPDEAGASYVADHYHADRLYGLVCDLLREGGSDLVVLEQGRTDIRDLAYLEHCYKRGHVSDRLSILVPHAQGHSRRGWLAINLYRQHGEPAFVQEDLARTEPLLRVVSAASIARHRLAETLVPFQPPVPLTSPRCLSLREAQVADLLCAGLSTPMIAAQLGVLSTTVTTLRKRAYAKLGASNGQEFAARWTRLRAN